jgi:hypothetical protein
VSEEDKKHTDHTNEEETAGQWSSVPVAVPSDASSSDQTQTESTHKVSMLKRLPSQTKSDHGANHSNHLLQQQHQRTKILQQQQVQAQETKPCVYSITVDYGSMDDTDSESSPLPEIVSQSSYTWMGAVGMLLWPSTDTKSDPNVVRSGPYEGCPTGSYGYLMHQISNEATTMCPPERDAWECLLLSKAQEVAMDVILDQIISLAAGLIDSLEVRTYP